MSFPFGTPEHNIPMNNMNNGPDYSANIIKAPEPNETGGRISSTLLIDSRDRNYVKYPNSHSYKIHLNKQYRDVVAIKLTMGMIPHSGFYITAQNNTLNFWEASNNYVVTITTGYYTKSELFAAIKAGMEGASLSTNSYTISTTAEKNYVQIERGSGTDSFSLQFLSTTGEYIENSIGPLLGFLPQNYSNQTTYTGSIPFCEYIDQEPYVAIHIDEAPNIISLGKGADNAFAIVPLQSNNTDGCGREFFGKNTANSGETEKHYNPPIGALRSMTIKFKKHDGTLYDFNGKEHFLLFDIYTLNSNQKYPHT